MKVEEKVMKKLITLFALTILYGGEIFIHRQDVFMKN